MESSEQVSDVISAIQSEMVNVLGDLTVAQVWLREGCTYESNTVSVVIPVLERTVTAAKEAVEKVLQLTQEVE